METIDKLHGLGGIQTHYFKLDKDKIGKMASKFQIWAKIRKNIFIAINHKK